MWAVVPLKAPAEAKQRLGRLLGPGHRAGLAAAMASDVLAALRQVKTLEGALVVTPDHGIADTVSRAGARVLVEPGADGYNAAVRRAAELLAGEGASAMLCIPGDVPLVAPAEVATLVAALQVSAAVALAPDADRDGTNALGLAPPTLIAPAFGSGSFRRHCAAAEAAGVRPAVFELSGLALDIDNEDDLRAFARRPGEGATRAWLAQAGLLARLSAA